MISSEAVSIILSIITIAIGAYAYRMKRDADVKLTEAETRQEQVKAEAVQFGQVMGMMTQQIAINEQFRATLEEKEKRDESNYRVMAEIQRDTNVQLVNIYNEQRRHTRILTTLSSSVATQVTTTLADQLASALRTTMQGVTGDIAAAVSRQMAVGSQYSNLVLFPDAEDPRWRRVWVIPQHDTVTIFKSPFQMDTMILRKPCAVIPREGEWLKIIAGEVRDWVIVDRLGADGERCYGYVLERMLTILDAPPTQSSSVEMLPEGAGDA